jgi:hypothetical protein
MIFVAFLVPSLSHRHLCCHCVIYQRLVVTGGSSGVDAGVDRRGFDVFVAEQLFDALEIAWVGVKRLRPSVETGAA